MEKALLRVGQAADALNVSRWTMYRWMEEGGLEATKIGKGRLRITQYSVLSLVENNRKDHLSLML